MNSKQYTLISLLMLFVLSAILMSRQLLIKGYFSCIIQDTFDYTSWAWQFTEALKEGIMYPRWAPYSYWGYGSPLFVLYAPVAFYMVAFFNLFTDSVILAMNLTKFFALFLSAVGMYFFVREFYSEKIALFSATFYVLFPYNIFGVYYSATFSSMISLIWFAPILLFLHRYIISGQRNCIVYAGLCYGGLILTHVVNAYMFTFVICSFVIFMSLIQRRLKTLVAIPLIICTGLLISAAYIAPLLYERSFINTETFMKEGFHYAKFFIIPNLTASLPAGSYWPVYYEISLFYVFLFIIMIFLFSLQIIKSRSIGHLKNTDMINIFFIGVSLCSLFLLFGASSFIWNWIPFFKYIVYPYRWLSITAFAITFLSAAGVFMFSDIYKTKRRHNIFIAVIFLGFLLLNYRYIGSACLFSEQELVPIKPANANTIHGPSWIDFEKIDRNDDGKKVTILNGEGKEDVIQWKSAERVIETTARQPITLSIRTFNFPGWKAYIDGVKTEIKTQDVTGAMLIEVPGGEHRLVVKFEDTPVRYYSKVISIVSLLTVCSILVLSGVCKKYS